MQYDRFNSPVPASFVRCDPTRKTGKATYKPTEYFHLTVLSYIGDGATGDVYGATVELLGTDGRIHSFPNVVVKFASLPEQRQRLRHEYTVYQRLKLSEITCVPHIFGLFKDAEGDTLALVMTNGGKSLASRRSTPDSYAFSVSKDEREKFIEALQSIHDQGFRHRDIRPENLLVAEDGEVQIIDFDRASLNSSEQTQQREMEHLFRVLEGPNKDFCGILGISVGSFCDSERASSGTPRGWEDTPDNSDVD
ncbi:hypothetical protein H0H93_010855 [Arthromyces matolae]|nr:hypothetical protein H0H93_010855 [Arthromyces matolae]